MSFEFGFAILFILFCGYLKLLEQQNLDINALEFPEDKSSGESTTLIGPETQVPTCQESSDDEVEELCYNPQDWTMTRSEHVRYPSLDTVSVVPYIYVPWTTTTSRMNTTTFIDFPRLPPELRIEIWKYLMPDPRTFLYSELCSEVDGNPNSPDGPILRTMHIHNRLLNPDRSSPLYPLLHVNAESRQIFLEQYQPLDNYSLASDLTIGNDGNKYLNSYITARKDCIDPKRDTLIVTAETLYEQVASSPNIIGSNLDLRNLRHLTIARHVPLLDASSDLNWLLVLKDCPQLRTLNLLLGNRVPPQSDGIYYECPLNYDFWEMAKSWWNDAPHAFRNSSNIREKHVRMAFLSFIAYEVRHHFQHCTAASPYDWSKVEFNVTLLGALSIVDKRVELIPSDSSIYDGTFKRFYTYEPQGMLEIFEIGISLPCNLDGSWPNRYLGVEELFQE